MDINVRFGHAPRRRRRRRTGVAAVIVAVLAAVAVLAGKMFKTQRILEQSPAPRGTSAPK